MGKSKEIKNEARAKKIHKYLDKFDNWRATVWIVTAVTIVVFFTAMGLVIKLKLL